MNKCGLMATSAKIEDGNTNKKDKKNKHTTPKIQARGRDKKNTFHSCVRLIATHFVLDNL